MNYAVRPAEPDDLPEIVRLCAAHAEYERAGPPAADLADQLAGCLFADRPRAHCFVVPARSAGPAALPGQPLTGIATDPDPPPAEGSRLAGYATGIREFDPVEVRDFLHMDCLYLDPPYRGRGLGRLLMAAIVDHARRSGLATVRWQTPDWNTDAVGFYQRLGAECSAWVQFTLA